MDIGLFVFYFFYDIDFVGLGDLVGKKGVIIGI